MKVLMLNGSPNPNGSTALALAQMQKVFNDAGVQCEVVTVGNKAVRGCVACKSCYQTGKCVFDDLVNELAGKLEEADGLVLASPVYYASPNATLIALLDRLFYSTRFDKRMKVGASVCVARRGGITCSRDLLNKYFEISGMPIASGQYWTGFHSGAGDKALDDEEGIQQLQTLAENMAFLIKSIALGKKELGLPEKKEKKYTNFIR